ETDGRAARRRRCRRRCSCCRRRWREAWGRRLLRQKRSFRELARQRANLEEALMRFVIAVLVAVSSTVVAAPAFACPVDNPVVVRPRPVGDSLLVQAARLEAQAAAADAMAVRAEREAESLALQATRMRRDARLGTELERARLMARASSMDARA